MNNQMYAAQGNCLGGSSSLDKCEMEQPVSRDIADQVNILESRIREVINRAGALRDRLAPLCDSVPPTPTTGSGQAVRELCPFADQIRTLTSGVEQANATISQIQNTLQV